MRIQTRAQITEWKRNISFLYKTEKNLGKLSDVLCTMSEIIILFETSKFQALFNTLTMYTSTQNGLICEGHLEFVVLPLFQIWGFLLMQNTGVKLENSETSLDLKQWNLKSGPSLSFGITFLILSSLISTVLHV